jgi:hypothetical protein
MSQRRNHSLSRKPLSRLRIEPLEERRLLSSSNPLLGTGLSTLLSPAVSEVRQALQAATSVATPAVVDATAATGRASDTALASLATPAAPVALDLSVTVTKTTADLGKALTPSLGLPELGCTVSAVLSETGSKILTPLEQGDGLLPLIGKASPTIQGVVKVVHDEVGSVSALGRSVSNPLGEVLGGATAPVLQPTGIGSVVGAVTGSLDGVVSTVTDPGNILPSLGVSVSTPVTALLGGIIPPLAQGTGISPLLHEVTQTGGGIVNSPTLGTGQGQPVHLPAPGSPPALVIASGSGASSTTTGNAPVAASQAASTTAIAGPAGAVAPGVQSGRSSAEVSPEGGPLVVIPAVPATEGQSGGADESAVSDAAAPAAGRLSAVTESGAEGAGEGVFESEEALAPRASDLVADVPPPDLSALQQGMQQLLGQLDDMGEGMARLLAGAGLWPWLAVAVVAAVTYEVARQRQEQLRRELALAAAARDAIPPWWLPGLADPGRVGE